MKRLLIILFLASINVLQAQSIFNSNDYAISWDGDTIRGFINEIGERRVNIANFKEGRDNIEKLSVKSIRAYVKNDTLFKNVAFVDTTDHANMLFMKVLFEGPVTFLVRESERKALTNLKDTKKNTTLIHKVKEEKFYVHGKSRIIKEINSMNFTETMMPLTADKERVQNRLRDKYYNFDNIILLLMDYKYLVENNVD